MKKIYFAPSIKTYTMMYDGELAGGLLNDSKGIDEAWSKKKEGETDDESASSQIWNNWE